MPTWYLYMIRTRDGNLYTGIGTDVVRRFAEHRDGGRKAARYLRGRTPLRLVFERKIGSKSLALKVESKVKRLPKHRKEQIIRSKSSKKDLVEMFAL